MLGKPVTPNDAGSGFIEPKKLKEYTEKAKKEIGWNSGIMCWQYQQGIESWAAIVFS